MCTLANSEDADEMPHYAAFHQCLHCLQDKNGLQGKKYNLIWKVYPVTPQCKQWTIPSLLYQTKGENPLVHKGLTFSFFVISTIVTLAARNGVT